MIIGIVGTIGSGKGTVVEYLKTKGFSHYSSGQTLAGIVSDRGLMPTRHNLTRVGQELANEREGGVVAYSYERAKKDGAENIVLEALHRKEEEGYIRKIGGVILGVDAALETRYTRIYARQEGEKDRVTFEQFQHDSMNEDDGVGRTSYIRDLMSRADALIMNNGTLDELHRELENALQSFV